MGFLSCLKYFHIQRQKGMENLRWGQFAEKNKSTWIFSPDMHRNTFLLYKLFLSSGLDRCLNMTQDTEMTCKSVFRF